MDNEKLNKLKEYNSKSHNKVMALANWINLNVKPFKVINALECIYDYAKGNFRTMDDIISHLTAKKKVYGRTQVYADNITPKMDIVTNGDGQLILKGYENADPLPLKGQKMDKNPNIYRKSDNQVKKTYQKTEEKLYDIGQEIRNMYPNASKVFISLAIVAVRKYAKEKKINTNNVIKGLKSGRLFLDDDMFIIRQRNNEGKVFIIDEQTAQLIAEELQMSEYKFYNAIKSFLHDLLVDPVYAKPSSILTAYGYTRGKLIQYLLRYNIDIRI